MNTPQMIAAAPIAYYNEIDPFAAQWLATDDQLTVRDLVEVLIATGQIPQTIYIRTGDDAVGNPAIQQQVEILAEHTGTRAIR